MATLSLDPVTRQEQIIEAIRKKFDDLPDSGLVYSRDRYAATLDKFLDLCAITDTENGNKRVIRTIFVKLVAPNPDESSGAFCKFPHKLDYEIEIKYQFEDLRQNGTNSTEGFNALLMRAFAAFGDDSNLGYPELDQTGLTTIEQAAYLSENKIDLHHITLGCSITINLSEL